jgi:uncharacterized protein (TIGR00369 family)
MHDTTNPPISYGLTPPDVLASMSGIDFLRKMFAGEFPHATMMQQVGLVGGSAEPGFVVFRAQPGPQHYNPIGTVHGGVASTLLDSCMSCAVHTHLERGFGYTTLELKVNLVRPITDKTGPIRAEGRSLHVGRRSGTAEGKILDARGTLLAHGTTTCLIFEL